MTGKNRTFDAVVVRHGITWFAGAGGIDIEFHATPEYARTDVARVVLRAGAAWFPTTGEGTLLWQGDGTPDTQAIVAKLRGAGCTISDTGHTTGWFTVRRTNSATVHLGIGPIISQARTSVTGLKDDARLTAQRFSRYAEMTGAAWRGTAGLSGCAAVRSLYEARIRGAQPLWRWDSAETLDAIRCSFELRGSKHRRALTPAELDAAYVHQFDVSAFYLASSITARVGWSAPVHSGPREFDPGYAGYWQVVRDELGQVPAELVRPGDDGLVWLTTPVLAFLRERGVSVEAVDSWTPERSGQYLRPWADQLGLALKTLDSDDPVDGRVREAVKDTYARTSGMFAKAGGRIFRPDWRDEVVDRARVNLLRKVYATKYSPVRMNVDSIWIATDKPQHEVARDLGVPYVDGKPVWQVGKFRWVKTMTPLEYLEVYEKGRVPA